MIHLNKKEQIMQLLFFYASYSDIFAVIEHIYLNKIY